MKKIREGGVERVEAFPVKVKIEDEDEQPNDKLTRTLSSHARARSVLEADNISFDTKLHCFNVKGLSGVTRVVTLFPRASCSCPSTGDCYHLLAVKLSVGMSVSTKPVQKNLTRLRRNTRSRKEKRCGRKRPRPNDVEPENQGETDAIAKC